ncbi:3-isopropylmalate dehydratase small subunit (plasmid) [Buchnera aphidicola (Melanaphis sacchari)]|uniref:3-isopropylmalate dehydratase small subunit n=1 Tax=Buchnera aphidicola (Melanaphis sacchari) TaxID=2173854 RepID=A0A2U8DH30_9GAMM|nr:3-isopropylmalate dehydratase small subunit [Buchnera aphidicola]AWH90781.1 3-isopropylmalate dehydratase small subunit [Buchnera aphidicola (Melanaphis sacchari)]
MFKFTEHSGIVAPLNVSNVDTDVIIPKQFLQRVNKNGLGKYLFHDWRFIDKNQKIANSDFILNKKFYKKSTILLTQENFGCGSSREHAVWALLDYGFRVIIAPSFSDIFYNNSFNNKLLLIILDQKDIDFLFDVVNKEMGIYLNVDLINNKISIKNINFSFKIDDFRRLFFLNNLDAIDLTMKLERKIKLYEESISSFFLNRRNFTS